MSEEGYKPEQNQDKEQNSNSKKESLSNPSEYKRYLNVKNKLEFYKSLRDQGVKEYDTSLDFLGLSMQPRISSVDSLISRQEELFQHIQSKFTESDIKALEDLWNNDEYQRLLKAIEDAYNLSGRDMARPGIIDDSWKRSEQLKSLAIIRTTDELDHFLLNYFKHNIS